MDAIRCLELSACKRVWLAVFVLTPALLCTVPASAAAPRLHSHRTTTLRPAVALQTPSEQAASAVAADLRIPTRLAGELLSYRNELERRGLRTTPLQGATRVPTGWGVGPAKPLQLSLSDAELRRILARHQSTANYAAFSPFDEITVTADTSPAPMSDVTQEVWSGLAAPLWAVLHPTQAWRILLPIPPR